MCLFQGEAGAPGENGADGVGGEEVSGVQSVIIRVISNTKGKIVQHTELDDENFCY